MSQNQLDKKTLENLQCLAFDLFPSPLLIIDSGQKCSSSNKLFTELFEQTETEALFSQLDQGLVEGRSNKPFTYPIELNTKQGELFQGQLIRTPLPSQFTLLEFKQVEDDLFTEKITELLAKAAHDLSNPLALLKLSSDCFVANTKKKGPPTSEALTKFLETLDKGINKMETSIKKVKNLTNSFRQNTQQTKRKVSEQSTTDLWENLDSPDLVSSP